MLLVGLDGACADLGSTVRALRLDTGDGRPPIATLTKWGQNLSAEGATAASVALRLPRTWFRRATLSNKDIDD